MSTERYFPLLNTLPEDASDVKKMLWTDYVHMARYNHKNEGELHRLFQSTEDERVKLWMLKELLCTFHFPAIELAKTYANINRLANRHRYQVVESFVEAGNKEAISYFVEEMKFPTSGESVDRRHSNICVKALACKQFDIARYAFPLVGESYKETLRLIIDRKDEKAFDGYLEAGFPVEKPRFSNDLFFSMTFDNRNVYMATRLFCLGHVTESPFTSDEVKSMRWPDMVFLYRINKSVNEFDVSKGESATDRFLAGLIVKYGIYREFLESVLRHHITNPADFRLQQETFELLEDTMRLTDPPLLPPTFDHEWD